LPLEERRSPKTIQLILKLLRAHRESLLDIGLIVPHDKRVPEAIEEVDSLIAHYERIAARLK
jgi:hypothetical protein